MEFQIEFNYQGSNTIIQCNTKDIMKDKFQSFLNKSKKDLNSVYFLYNGNIIEGTKTIEQISNKPDLERRKMTILVFDNEEDEENEKMLVKPKDISCPKCGEPAKVNLSEFKLFFQCKKGHNTGNILLSDYKDSQKVDISKILCGKCKSVNKANSYEHMFFRCLTCKIDLCPMCKSTHEKDHDVIDYEEKNYICEKHNKYFSSYCETCKKNTCIFCEKEHHEVKVEDENEDIIDDVKEAKDIKKSVEGKAAPRRSTVDTSRQGSSARASVTSTSRPGASRASASRTSTSRPGATASRPSASRPAGTASTRTPSRPAASRPSSSVRPTSRPGSIERPAGTSRPTGTSRPSGINRPTGLDKSKDDK